MNAIIKKFLVNEFGFIYVHTIDNILYYHDNTHFMPFLTPLENVKKCFQIFDQHLIYYNHQIIIFDPFLKVINRSPNWIDCAVDDVCCHANKNIIVTLESNNVYIHFNVIPNSSETDNTISKFFLNAYCDRVLHYGTIGSTQFKKIKIINDFLLVYDGTKISIFNFGIETVKNHVRLTLSEELFDQIVRVNDIAIYYRDGFTFLQTAKTKFISVEEQTLFENHTFSIHKIYFSVKNKNLICFYDAKYTVGVVEKLLRIVDCQHVIKTDFCGDYHVISFDYTNDIVLIEECNHQMLLINNWLYQIIDQSLVKFKFNDEKIIYHNLIKLDESRFQFKIDIVFNQPVVDQLIKIIPAIYRLNSKIAFHFEQVNEEGAIQSHGVGVTRQIFTMLALELNRIFKNGLEHSDFDLLNLGKLVYFCVNEGSQKLKMPAIFFYFLSKQSDHLILLKRFKKTDYARYKKQYLHYLQYPEQLIDVDLSDVDQYVKYLLSCHLTETEIEAYQKLTLGYTYFASRTKNYSLIKALPISYSIQHLSDVNDLFVLFKFMKHPQIENRLYTNFKNNFNKCLLKLTKQTEKFLIQNITGSKYYVGYITVILYPVSETGDPTYQISTCEATLTLFIHPTLKNLSKIFDFLVLKDLSLKD